MVRVNLPTGREPTPNIARDEALATNTSRRKITSLVEVYSTGIELMPPRDRRETMAPIAIGNGHDLQSKLQSLNLGKNPIPNSWG
jgi:hypothetical protein